MSYPNEPQATRGMHRLRKCLVAGLLAGACLALLSLTMSSAQLDSPVALNPVATLWLATDGYGLAWGDVDGDGDLDLAFGNRLYLNEDGKLQTTAAWIIEPLCVHPEFGDVDGDGDLDLAIFCKEPPQYSEGHGRVYLNKGLNEGQIFTSTIRWNHDPVFGWPHWGDMDGDGYLDLALGPHVYHNVGGVLTNAPAWTAKGTIADGWGDMNHDNHLDLALRGTNSILVYTNTGTILGDRPAWKIDFTNPYIMAWGDVNGDGYPELAVSGRENDGPTYVYSNTGKMLTDTNPWESEDTHRAYNVAWGDVDGDGDLDLLVATGNNAKDKIYLNVNKRLQSTAVWESGYFVEAEYPVWGDVDGDGDLDLAMQHCPGWGRVHTNESWAVQTAPILTITTGTGGRPAVAWGDVDGDGDLDLAVGSRPDTHIYLNESGALQPDPVWTDSAEAITRSVAWGDMDGDGDLDLAVGNDGSANKVYLNESGALGLQLTPVWTDNVDDRTHSVAWGDMDGDGDLDLAVGNRDSANKVYLNESGALGLKLTPVWIDTVDDPTYSVAWGDMDGDGDLDLAVGNLAHKNKVYLNVNGQLQTPAAWESNTSEPTRSVAWGDMDGDGDLDLAVGNGKGHNNVYTNLGTTLGMTPTWTSLDWDDTYMVAWGDADGDGDLDLAAANQGGEDNTPARIPDRIYMNNGGMLQTMDDGPWTPTDPCATSSIAWGDMDGDGHLDLAIGQSHCHEYNDDLPDSREGDPPRVKVYLNQQSGRATRPIQTAALALTPTVAALAPANFYAVPGIRASGSIPITYTLFHPSSDPARCVRAFYSPGGGGQWREARATADTITTSLAASPYPTVTAANTHVYTWDVFSSGFFGRSDNVVLRLEAYPVSCHDGITGTFRYTNSIPGPYQRPYISAQTFPFRVRGTQVRVISGTMPVANALVYRLPAGHSAGATPLARDERLPFRTDAEGYLQGQGVLEEGDRLVALAPISATDSYTLYYTSAELTSADTVTKAGVHTLTVSSENPLTLFDLDISLEWDARKEKAFLEQLGFDLRRTSELLYDWTDGQAALGEATVYHDREHWNEADVRIYATNRLRPNANQGGVVSQVSTETIPLPSSTRVITYAPGQVRIGPVWSRYGDPMEEIGDDWPRALAHELGHYLFFLDDNYLGLDDAGHLIPVEDCTGAMSDPYREDYPYDEFHHSVDWTDVCSQTLSHRITGRSDWETITTFYPALLETTNPGPAGLPLALPEIRYYGPVTDPMTLDDPTFQLSHGGALVLPDSSARAFLFRQEGDALIDLGSPTLDRVLARGARPGDRLCVFEPGAERLGCEIIQTGDEQLELTSVSGWRPDVIISPVTSRTIAVTVTTPDMITPAEVSARLFPVNGGAPETISLTPKHGVYGGTFHLADPAPAGYVDVWVPEDSRREIVTDYALGGAPAEMHGGGGCVYQRGRSAPAVSSDGQVILFGDVDLAKGEFFTLQAATAVPHVRPWMAVVGKAYRLSASSVPTSRLSQLSISFNYLGREVPPGEESWLRVYFLAPGASEWQPLPTVRDPYRNFASAPTQGPGLYALMSSIEIPLYQPGWNLFSYPVQATRPVSQALLSIADYYSITYGYDAQDEVDPWKVYGVGAPAWVNDLEELEFGRVYWISTTKAITLYLKGASDPDRLATLQAAGGMEGPPATFYGAVLGSDDFTPTVGMTVTAWIDGHPCGQGQTECEGDRIVYDVNVFATGSGGAAGCGTPGQTVRFRVGPHAMFTTAAWDNNRLWELALSPGPPKHVYLPLVMRQHVRAPDLVVDRIAPIHDNDFDNIEVVVRNQSNAPATDDFWVDLYVDPDPIPTAVNQIWNDLADEGVVWDVTADIRPGEALTLTIGDAYTSREYSDFSGSLEAGTWIYVQADSANADTDYGGVLEDHEMTGDPYNNIAGVRLSVPVDVGPLAGDRPTPPAGHLPPRP